MKAHHLPLPVEHAHAECITRRELLTTCALVFLFGAICGAILFGEALLALHKTEQSKLERTLK
jgi:hypothetical protein